MPFLEKLTNAMIAKLVGYLVLLPGVILWFGWVYGGQIYQRSWVLPVQTAQAFNLHLLSAKTAEEDRDRQYKQIQSDLDHLKMIWGTAKIQATGGNEVFALVNRDSPALRFRPGQEVWVTNNSHEGDIRIKVKIREGGFTDKSTVLLRLSKEAGQQLEAMDPSISVGIAIVSTVK